MLLVVRLIVIRPTSRLTLVCFVQSQVWQTYPEVVHRARQSFRMRALLRTISGSPRPASSASSNTANLSTLTKAWTSLDRALADVDANGNGSISKDGKEKRTSDIKDVAVWLDAIQSALAAEAARMTSSENDTGPCLEYVVSRRQRRRVVDRRTNVWICMLAPSYYLVSHTFPRPTSLRMTS